MPAPNSYYRISSSPAAPLRVGLLVDSLVEAPAFTARIITDIKASNFARLELLVVRKSKSETVASGPSKPKPRSLVRHLSDPKLRKRLLYDLYLRMDSRMKPAKDPLAKTDVRELFSGIETIEVEPLGKKFIHRFPDDALEKIRSRNLDVLIRFGFNILHGEILTTARYGVWSYHHGDNEFYRGGPPLFWELVEGSRLSGVLLQLLTEELDGGLVFCKSLFCTQDTVSVARNRFAPYWGSTDLVIRKLNELHRLGWDEVKNRSVSPAPYKGKRKIYRNPSNWDMARWLGPILVKKMARRPFRTKSVQHWRIAVRRTNKLLFEPGANDDPRSFSWIESPKGQFWADPFLLEHSKRTWLFFENYSYPEKRAWISCAEVSADATVQSPIVCLDRANHHYSYPYVFEHDFQIYMVPEAFDSGAVELYRCSQFPQTWVHEATLLEGGYVDTSLWQHDGLWWMMTTSAEPDARAGSLVLFFAESLHGPWQFHPANPISTDIRTNRNAGRIFQRDQTLWRPSQSSCPIYGYSFSLNQITQLSKTRYEERPVKTLEPSKQMGLDGIHTYNWCGDLEVIDGQAKTPLRSLLPQRS